MAEKAMDPRLKAYAERPAPRYTSYPTAPNFTSDIEGATYASWLSALKADAPLSLYMHVPFCREICRYCGCHTFASLRDAPIEAYVESLRQEIAMVAQASPARVVRTIAWGGGTPNILSHDLFLRAYGELYRRFDLSALVEHAVEIDPRLVTLAQAQIFARCGVTRASLGVQDLNPQVQEAIGRIQPATQVEHAIAALRNAGIAAINLDLMYGLPRQSVAGARATAVQAASWAPERIAVFGYAHVPWFKSRQRLIDEAELPNAETRFAQADAMREVFGEAGYVEIGFDHYAKPDDALARATRSGGLTRSFQGYSPADCDALIGFGASAISTLPQGYAQNAPQPGLWSESIHAGGFATTRGVALSDDDRVRRDIINRILCDFRVDLAQFGGLSAFDGAQAHLAALAHDGLLTLSGDVIEITHQGRAFARLAAEAFDAYRAHSTARHSRAV